MADTKVLIAGAGPTGLVLASDLARRGITATLVDAAPGPPPGSRAKALQPRTLEIFEDLGLLDELLAAGRFDLPMQLWDGPRRGAEHDLYGEHRPTPDRPYTRPLFVPQLLVEARLRAHLAALGVPVQWNTRLAGLTQRDDEVTAELVTDRGTQQLGAQYLVGCDGGRSTVRHLLGVGFDGATWDDQQMLLGDVEIAGADLDPDHWHMWRTPTGSLGLCPLPGTGRFQFEAEIDPVDDPAGVSLERLQQLADERTGLPALRLASASWLSRWRANARLAEAYRRRQVLLAGDAAHVHSPMGGQGLNTGIGDAYNLGWKLAAALRGAPPELLDSYEAERRPAARGVLDLTSALSGTQHLPDAAARRGRAVLQLDLSYRGSPLACDTRGPRPVLAGDRAPDAPGLVRGGRTHRLFELLRGPQSTVVGFGPETRPLVRALAEAHPQLGALTVVDPGDGDPAGCDVVDSAGHARTAYQPAAGDLLVIRPDGYLGVGCPSSSPGPAADYLRHVLPAGAVGAVGGLGHDPRSPSLASAGSAVGAAQRPGGAG